MKLTISLLLCVSLIQGQVLPHTPYFDRITQFFHKLNEFRAHPTALKTFEQTFYGE